MCIRDRNQDTTSNVYGYGYVNSNGTHTSASNSAYCPLQYCVADRQVSSIVIINQAKNNRVNMQILSSNMVAPSGHYAILFGGIYTPTTVSELTHIRPSQSEAAQDYTATLYYWEDG